MFFFFVFSRYPQNEQTELSDSEIEAVFAKYAGSLSATTPNELPGILNYEGFSTFLMSNENTPFSEQGKPIWQDMTIPISDYYISSSHNTYLVGNQLVGVSTIEGYIRALLHSCRSVERESSLVISHLLALPRIFRQWTSTTAMKSR